MKDNVPAIKVMHAIYSVYADVGDKDYAKRKTNNFLKRCGADINKPKYQLLDINLIKNVVYAMLDEECEKVFWLRLNSQ